MKLVPKLTLALFGATCVVLAVNASLRVRREVGYVQAARVHDHEMVGRALGASVNAMWRSEGRDAALAVIDAANSHFSKFDIRWVERADAKGACGGVWRDVAGFEAARAGRPSTVVASLSDAQNLVTCVPVDASGARQGLIELREVLPAGEGAVRAAVRDASLTAIAIASVSALLSWLLGVWLVGRPVTSLTEKARRIARGDFEGPLVLDQADEFTVLATELNATCTRLSTTLDQLRHADRLTTVGKLASGVAHELGTPLNVVSARAEMIAAGETSREESIEYARVIGSATQRMTRIIQQLLEFARKRGTRKTDHDLKTLVVDTVELLRPLAKKRNVELDVALDRDPFVAAVDAGQIEQVVTNLLMNAVHAMPGGGRVLVSMDHREARPPHQHGAETNARRCLALIVRDEGEGIAEDDLPHIFEPFYTTKDVGEGTGLGLSVSYGIIEEHGGWIDVESARGRGATFTVYLPQASAHQGAS